MLNSPKEKEFKNFQDFWPFYLSQHQNIKCRICHLWGTATATILVGFSFFSGKLIFVLIGLGIGYGLAWWGHFAYEKNRPATFQYPLYSFIADLKMFWLRIREIFD